MGHCERARTGHASSFKTAYTVLLIRQATKPLVHVKTQQKTDYSKKYHTSYAIQNTLSKAKHQSHEKW